MIIQREWLDRETGKIDIEKVPGEVLWKQAYEELFERDYNKIAEEIETYRNNRRKA